MSIKSKATAGGAVAGDGSGMNSPVYIPIIEQKSSAVKAKIARVACSAQGRRWQWVAFDAQGHPMASDSGVVKRESAALFASVLEALWTAKRGGWRGIKVAVQPGAIFRPTGNKAEKALQSAAFDLARSVGAVLVAQAGEVQ